MTFATPVAWMLCVAPQDPRISLKSPRMCPRHSEYRITSQRVEAAMTSMRRGFRVLMAIPLALALAGPAAAQRGGHGGGHGGGGHGGGGHMGGGVHGGGGFRGGGGHMGGGFRGGAPAM